MRIREYGYEIGSLPTGKLNKISDVAGVTVGHKTIISNNHHTGITVVMPSEDNTFTNKFPCACYAMNGFGKSQGLMQIEETGSLETPIALTNTLNVGMVHDYLVGYMVDRCKEDNIDLTSVNPVVCECNDYALNDIKERITSRDDFYDAVKDASADFAEGNIGCGCGTSCFGLKGGVGSASRIINIGGKDYTIGILVQTNFGRIPDLTLCGKNIGKDIEKKINEALPDKGSCIVILATDLPVSDRQLKRIIKRCSVGLIRLGGYIGNQSGEVFIGFSTANRYSQLEGAQEIIDIKMINENMMDTCFRAAAESTEEAILNSMVCSETTTGFNGNIRYSLADFIK